METVGLFLLAVLSLTHGYAPLHEPQGSGYGKGSILQDVMERMNRDMDPDTQFFDISGKMDEFGPVPGLFLPGRATKDSEFMDAGDYDVVLSPSGSHVSSRDSEYLQHSSLFGHKVMSGGASESALHVKGQKVPAEIKTDAVLPAYCNPPNPCPVDYTAEDGCIESHSFVNTAAFSRAYQASQDCMCDTEHMFDCPRLSDAEEELEFSGQQLLSDLQVEGQHKSLVAKKFYNKQAHEDRLSRLNTMAKEAAAAVNEAGARPEVNPFLQGDKLPIAAKKGNHALVY